MLKIEVTTKEEKQKKTEFTWEEMKSNPGVYKRKSSEGLGFGYFIVNHKNEVLFYAPLETLEAIKAKHEFQWNKEVYVKFNESLTLTFSNVE